MACISKGGGGPRATPMHRGRRLLGGVENNALKVSVASKRQSISQHPRGTVRTTPRSLTRLESPGRHVDWRFNVGGHSKYMLVSMFTAVLRELWHFSILQVQGRNRKNVKIKLKSKKKCSTIILHNPEHFLKGLLRYNFHNPKHF